MLPLQALEFLGANPGKTADGEGDQLIALGGLKELRHFLRAENLDGKFGPPAFSGTRHALVIGGQVALAGREIKQHGQRRAQIVPGALAHWLTQDVLPDHRGADFADGAIKLLREPAQPVAQVAQVQGADRALARFKSNSSSTTCRTVMSGDLRGRCST